MMTNRIRVVIKHNKDNKRINMKKYGSILLLLGLLSGCISNYADNQCRSEGFEPGTSAYNHCFNQIAQQQQRCMMAYSQAQMQPTLGGSSLAAQANGLAAMQAMGCQ